MDSSATSAFCLVVTIHDSTEFTAKCWALCLPVDMSVEETKWFERRTAKQSDIDIQKPWGGTKLAALLLDSKNRGIKEAFFKGEHRTGPADHVIDV